MKPAALCKVIEGGALRSVFAVPPDGWHRFDVLRDRTLVVIYNRRYRSCDFSPPWRLDARPDRTRGGWVKVSDSDDGDALERLNAWLRRLRT